MLVEKKLSEALEDYLKGRKVLVLCNYDDDSMSIENLSEILDKEELHYLVDVPATVNQEFEAAVQNIVSGDANQKPETSEQEENEPAEDSEAFGGGP